MEINAFSVVGETMKVASRCVLAIAAIGLLAPFARAADPTLVAAAKKEGEVTWYTTLIVNQMARPAADAFQRKYGIKVNYVRNETSDIIRRILNESQAGQIQADVLDGTSGAPVLKRANALQKWLPAVAAQLPKEYMDPEGYWIATSLYVQAIAYNTEQVKKEEAPHSLEDLLDPKWKGKIALSDSPSAPGVGGFIGFVLGSMGENRGIDYLKNLARQNVSILQVSTRQVLDQVIAGEYAIAAHALNHHVAFSANRGAPIAWVQTKPETMASLLVLGLLRGPHPNAGKLLIDFLMSDEGQAIFRDADYIPVAPNVPPKDSTLRPDSTNFKALYFTPETIDENQKKWMNIYQQILR
jgi:iron(III) transport system substrate-binding protein